MVEAQFYSPGVGLGLYPKVNVLMLYVKLSILWLPIIEGLNERTERLDIFLFPPITQWCSISDVLFTGGSGLSDFSVLK